MTFTNTFTNPYIKNVHYPISGGLYSTSQAFDKLVPAKVIQPATGYILQGSAVNVKTRATTDVGTTGIEYTNPVSLTCQLADAATNKVNGFVTFSDTLFAINQGEGGAMIPNSLLNIATLGSGIEIWLPVNSTVSTSAGVDINASFDWDYTNNVVIASPASGAAPLGITILSVPVDGYIASWDSTANEVKWANGKIALFRI